MLAHWGKVPPIAHSLAAIASFLGVGRKSTATPVPPKVKPPEASSGGNVQELFELLGGNGFGMEKPAWLNQAAAGTM